MLDQSVLNQIKESLSKQINKKLPSITKQGNTLHIVSNGKQINVITPSSELQRSSLGSFQ